jgi:hypothetical protein
MCIYKCMLNVYKNQQNRQTESMNLMGPKTFPTILGTYMKLVTKYQITVIKSCIEKCEEKYAYLIFGHNLHIGTLYRGKRFWTHQIHTSCFADFVDFYTHLTYICICIFFVTFF